MFFCRKNNIPMNNIKTLLMLNYTILFYFATLFFIDLSSQKG